MKYKFITTYHYSSLPLLFRVSCALHTEIRRARAPDKQVHTNMLSSGATTLHNLFYGGAAQNKQVKILTRCLTKNSIFIIYIYVYIYICLIYIWVTMAFAFWGVSSSSTKWLFFKKKELLNAKLWKVEQGGSPMRSFNFKAPYTFLTCITLVENSFIHLRRWTVVTFLFGWRDIND